MKIRHTSFAILFLGLFYGLTITALQPENRTEVDSWQPNVSKVRTQQSLTTPLFFETQSAQVVSAFSHQQPNTDHKPFDYWAGAFKSSKTHTVNAKLQQHIFDQLERKTTLGDLLYPSHFFW